MYNLKVKKVKTKDENILFEVDYKKKQDFDYLEHIVGAEVLINEILTHDEKNNLKNIFEIIENNIKRKQENN